MDDDRLKGKLIFEISCVWVHIIIPTVFRKSKYNALKQAVRWLVVAYKRLVWYFMRIEYI